MSAVEGAIIGDIAGSKYEFNNIRHKNFELIDKDCYFTDDTILTLAIKKAIIYKQSFDEALREVCAPYIDSELRSFGLHFRNYVRTGKSNHSYGNGSAIRVAYIADHFQDLKTVLQKAEESAIASHTHPDATSGAKCIAGAAFLAKDDKSKQEILEFCNTIYKIDPPSIKPTGNFDVSCAGSVPLAIKAVMETSNFEDCIKTSISYGGDSDCIACMAGTIAGHLYPINPKHMVDAMCILDALMNELFMLSVKKDGTPFEIKQGSIHSRWFFDTYLEAIPKD